MEKKKAPQPPPQLQPGPDHVKRALEADASERAEKRKAEATVLKDQGNQAFKEGDYTRAAELYTQGLERLKDFVVLYTNRAQAYNKLEKFTEAVEDCRTALQLEPNNVKALVHLGKAHQGLKDYEAAVTTYKEILKIGEKYEKMVADYIAAANNAESTAKSDKEAERPFNEGDDKATGVQKTEYPQRGGASVGSIGTISGSHDPIIVGSSVNITYNLPSKEPENAGLSFESGAETLATKLSRGRPTEVNCKSNEDMKSLSDYLQHVTPPLEGTQFFMDVKKQDLTLLRGILLSDSMKSAMVIYVKYDLSEQEEEELSLLEETLGVLDEQHCALLFISVHIKAKSWFDMGRTSHSIFRLQEQIRVGRLGLGMFKRSPDEVVDMLKALEGCRLTNLLLCDTDLHSLVRHVSHIPLSLSILQLAACSLVDDDVKDLISILPARHDLQSLALDYNVFSLDAVEALTHHLQGLTKFCVLSLKYIDLDPWLIRQVVGRNLPHLKETEEGHFQA